MTCRVLEGYDISLGASRCPLAIMAALTEASIAYSYGDAEPDSILAGSPVHTDIPHPNMYQADESLSSYGVAIARVSEFKFCSRTREHVLRKNACYGRVNIVVRSFAKVFDIEQTMLTR